MNEALRHPREAPGASGDDRAQTLRFLADLVPGGRPLADPYPPLEGDECRWFVAGVRAGLFRFRDCATGCQRLRRSGAKGPDEFVNPRGEQRHLYSAPNGIGLRLNREYVTHIAAHARGVLGLGYPADRAEFSCYRTFGGDRLTKRKGGSFELDSLFYAGNGRPYLHVEVKGHPRTVARIAAGIDRFRDLEAMPTEVAKEVEYVLELAPAYFWLAGPGTVDPEAHVWRVRVASGRAMFDRLQALPPPPSPER